MKDNLSLIYETSMEVRKALMDARIKKGSALTPEETNEIVSVQSAVRHRYYGYAVQVNVAYVHNILHNHAIDLNSLTDLRSTVITGKYEQVNPDLEKFCCNLMGNVKETIAPRVLDPSVDYYTPDSRDDYKLYWFDSNFNAIPMDQASVMVRPPFIHFVGKIDRSPRRDVKNSQPGPYVMYMGMAWLKEKGSRNYDFKANEAMNTLQSIIDIETDNVLSGKMNLGVDINRLTSPTGRKITAEFVSKLYSYNMARYTIAYNHTRK